MSLISPLQKPHSGQSVLGSDRGPTKRIEVLRRTLSVGGISEKEATGAVARASVQQRLQKQLKNVMSSWRTECGLARRKKNRFWEVRSFQ